jgi:hypothetical protein
MQADDIALGAMAQAIPDNLGEKARWALKHIEREAVDDLEGTLATLAPDPVYDFYPIGLRMRGMDLIRRYYAHFFTKVRPHIVNYVVHSYTYGESSMVTELTLTWRYDDGSTRDFRNITVLVYGEGGIAGERMYGEPEFFRLFFGPVLAELEPVAP